MIGIYKITNKENGKVYIGQSDNCERRIQEHKKERHLSIDMWINFLGKDAFNYEIIEECSKVELDEKEKFYISQYNSTIDGYNLQEGGFNNSSGSGNGRAKLTEADIIKIRQAYANHLGCKETFKEFEGRISYSQFQGIWQGRSWSNIMPEVFSEENKAFYVSGKNKETTTLTKEEVLKYRIYYKSHTMDETYVKFCKDKGSDFFKRGTLKKIILGDVRENSVYNEVPVYKKQLKQWLLKGKPVSTIHESVE